VTSYDKVRGTPREKWESDPRGPRIRKEGFCSAGWNGVPIKSFSNREKENYEERSSYAEDRERNLGTDEHRKAFQWGTRTGNERRKAGHEIYTLTEFRRSWQKRQKKKAHEEMK